MVMPHGPNRERSNCRSGSAQALAVAALPQISTRCPDKGDE